MPLSYEQALAMGRTGRILGSPVLNGGYKSKGLHARHSDSDGEQNILLAVFNSSFSLPFFRNKIAQLIRRGLVLAEN